jgi:hypothetical protein
MKSSDKNKNPEPDVTYEEIGRVHRYFLNWRNALFAGHITVIYAHVIGYSWLINQQDTSILQILLLSSGFFMTMIFWGLEFRNRGLYRACLYAGKAWEENNKVIGVYKELLSVKSSIRHSRVLDIYYGFVLFAITMFVYFGFYFHV